MADPDNYPLASRTRPFESIQIANNPTSETTSAQFTADAMAFTTATPSSFAIGDHISGNGIQKGTTVTDIVSSTIYMSKPLTGTLGSGNAVTIFSDRRGDAGGPPAFELKAGSGISISNSTSPNATGAPVITIVADGGGTASALAADDLSAGDAAVTLTTTTGNITIDAQAGDSDIIFKGTDGSSDTTFLTLDGSEAGKAIFNADVTVGDDLTLLSDASVLGFGTHTDVTLTHVHDTGLLLNGAMELQFRDSGLTIGSTADGQLDIDADVNVDISSQITAIDATTGISLASPSIVLSDDASGKPVVEIKNTTNDTASAELKFVKDKGAAGADGDDIGKITFVGDDSGGAQTSFAQILVEVSEADNTDEAGKMSFLVAESDGTNTALTAGLILEGQHATDGVVDVTIGAGSGSVTTIAGDLTVNGTTTTINSTTLNVDDDMITISKGNDTLGNADGSGIEIECTGATNPTLTYQDTPAGWESNVNLNLASGKSYKINDVAVYGATTIHSNVTSAAGLTTVSALDTGSIASGFGTISTGNTITTSATLTGGAIVGTSLAVSGTITGDTSLTLDATTLTTAELGVLDSVTAGTVSASKALVVDGNKDIASLRNITATGTTQTGVLSVDAVAIIDTSSENTQSVGTGAAHAAFTYAYGTYRTAKFVYQITDGTDFESGEILVNYKGASAPAASTDIYLTQYATVSTKANNAAIVTWDAVKNGTDIELKFTNPTGGSLSYSYDVVNTLLIK
jgi:hypothetical protein